MNPETLLQQLAPLREPTPISWWPPAPGWWLLALAVVIGLILLATWWWTRYRRGQYRRTAVAQLGRLAESGNVSVAEVNTLLKATALRAWPASEVASLHGKDWLSFLASSDLKNNASPLDALEGIYSDPGAPASKELISAAQHWIQHHRNNTPKGTDDD